MHPVLQQKNKSSFDSNEFNNNSSSENVTEFKQNEPITEPSNGSKFTLKLNGKEKTPPKDDVSPLETYQAKGAAIRIEK